MLRALANHLKQLASNNFDQFRESIANRLDGKATEEQIGALKEFIFLLPPTLKQLSGFWSDPNTPQDAKRLSGLILSYVYQPDDFLPEDSNGLFGYLDDAYVTVSAFIQIQDLYIRNWQEKSSEEIDLEKRARNLIVAPKIVIPDEVRRIDNMIESFMSGEIESFEEFLEINE